MQKHETMKLAYSLMQEHDVMGWRVDFDNAKRRFGVTRYYTRTITLSEPLMILNGETIVKDVLLHEIAHAIMGQGAGHGMAWRMKARSIGCSATRCVDTNVVLPTLKYTATCATCGNVSQRARRVRRTVACGKCCKGTYNKKYLLTWIEN